MIKTKKNSRNSILQSVIEDYDKKIKKLHFEEEFPAEYNLIHKNFKEKVKRLIINNKYNKLILKIKEYNMLKELCLF